MLRTGEEETFTGSNANHASTERGMKITTRSRKSARCGHASLYSDAEECRDVRGEACKRCPLRLLFLRLLNERDARRRVSTSSQRQTGGSGSAATHRRLGGSIAIRDPLYGRRRVGGLDCRRRRCAVGGRCVPIRLRKLQGFWLFSSLSLVLLGFWRRGDVLLEPLGRDGMSTAAARGRTDKHRPE